ncbi:hypothetical protein PROFUN_15037 [Planoprotostelium fungivorum]|uniref:Uncharacterized protein n=1 Tax=Planoprotostelium fungivorum TaxID=1890364 RepID=A0A2P6MZP2_9EUKA|nr:hypothetical protein PROFUN_15037 [Planoprotostelium fungivorum]
MHPPTKPEKNWTTNGGAAVTVSPHVNLRERYTVRTPADIALVQSGNKQESHLWSRPIDPPGHNISGALSSICAAFVCRLF